MTLYLDTSVLVTLLTREPRSEEVEVWLTRQQAHELASSGWVAAEVSSALSSKLRAAQLSEETRNAALAEFRRLRSNSMVMYSVKDEHLSAAARICDYAESGLRAGDALHLAIARDHGLTVCTRDKAMARGGPTLGVETVLVGGLMTP